MHDLPKLTSAQISKVEIHTWSQVHPNSNVLGIQLVQGDVVNIRTTSRMFATAGWQTAGTTFTSDAGFAQLIFSWKFQIPKYRK